MLLDCKLFVCYSARMTEWQPIVTCDAPDWERVLIADDDGDVGPGYRTEDGDWYISLDAGESYSTPTHWMPMPMHPTMAVPA